MPIIAHDPVALREDGELVPGGLRLAHPPNSLPEIAISLLTAARAETSSRPFDVRSGDPA
jgi:hypothetical protein